jgi:Stress responsive A/B Barrel Domain
MGKSTRRSALRHCCAVVGTSLLALKLPTAVAAQAMPVGVLHAFAFQWKPGTSEAQKDRAKKDIEAFQGMIAGLLQTNVGQNISPRGKGYTFGGIMQFKDEASLEAYFQHPAHQALLAWLAPLIDAVELDLRA